MREITYTEALMEAFREEMRRDIKVFHLCGGLGALASLLGLFLSYWLDLPSGACMVVLFGVLPVTAVIVGKGQLSSR